MAGSWHIYNSDRKSSNKNTIFFVVLITILSLIGLIFSSPNKKAQQAKTFKRDSIAKKLDK